MIVAFSVIFVFKLYHFMNLPLNTGYIVILMSLSERSDIDNLKTSSQCGFRFCMFCCFTSQVNSYGHGGTVSSPNHTFFLGKLEQAVNQYFMHILSPVTDNNPS